MARKFDLQLRSWIPLIIESYFTYETLNTFEIVKHSGRALVILGGEGQVREILAVLDFLIKAKYLLPKAKTSAAYFGATFDSYTYEISEKFQSLVEESRQKSNNPNPGDWIHGFRIENITHNTYITYNFNFTLALEKLLEVKAGLFNT